MRAGCVICSDTLDERKPASAAKCGHVYHTTCLTEWIGKSKTCPLCRTRITIDEISKLYFNFSLGSDFDISQLETEISQLETHISASKNQLDVNGELSACRAAKDDVFESMRKLGLKVANLKCELIFKNAELSVYRQGNDRISASLRKAKSKVSFFRNAMLECESENQDLIVKAAESASEMKSKILSLEQMNEKLYNELEDLKNINTVVVGTQDDVESILASNSGTKKHLVTYCACLKRELVNQMESKKALEESNAELKTALRNFVEKVECCYVSASEIYEAVK